MTSTPWAWTLWPAWPSTPVRWKRKITTSEGSPAMATKKTAGKHDYSKPLATNKHLLRWVEKMAKLTRADAIHWVDGSQAEYDFLCGQMVESGTFLKLNQK